MCMVSWCLVRQPLDVSAAPLQRGSSSPLDVRGPHFCHSGDGAALEFLGESCHRADNVHRWRISKPTPVFQTSRSQGERGDGAVPGGHCSLLELLGRVAQSADCPTTERKPLEKNLKV